MTPPPKPPQDGVSEHERLLAARAADGDGGAIEQLYDRYEKRLFNYCHRITGNREDAADATQEAFCNVIQRLPGMDVAQLNFAAYLFTAARNASLDIIAQRKRAIATDEVPEEAGAMLPIEFDPERSALNEDQKRAARAANAQLPEKQRAVLALREVAELSYDDIASAMDMNSNSVAQLISRARLNFYKQLRGASIVIPPLDEAGQRAIELAVARQDGRIEDEELTWLEQHLRENEASRINVEAMHESTLIYRAIGPVAVLAALRNSTVAKAADMVSHQVDRGGQGATNSVGSSAPRPGASNVTGEASATIAGASSTGQVSRRRRSIIAGTLLLALILALTAVSGLGDDTVEQVEPAAESIPGTTGEARKDTAGKSSAGDVNDPSASNSTAVDPYHDLQADTDDPNDKGEPARSKRKQPSDDAATEQPTAQPTPETPPAEPTGPTGKPPGPKQPPSGPPILCGNNCNGPTVN